MEVAVMTIRNGTLSMLSVAFGLGFACADILAQQPVAAPSQASDASHEYRTLATNRTSTMQKEMNLVGQEGFRFAGVMGGETAFGGSEVVVVMSKNPVEETARFEYSLLATSRTSTMHKEIQAAADAGFEYRGQTVFSTTFGGDEVVVIMERDPRVPLTQYEYKLLATSKTSTMQKELAQAGGEGYSYVGLTVGKTAFGGSELVVIVRKPRPAAQP
jgi:hypothetical protein